MNEGDEEINKFYTDMPLFFLIDGDAKYMRVAKVRHEAQQLL